jgi:hypothetical protein
LALNAVSPVSRYLGLCLGGAKSDRTCVTVIDHYRKQDKAFVVDIYESIGPQEGVTADQALIDLIAELSKDSTAAHQEGIRVMGVDAPLTLPPCVPECDAACEGYDKCRKPAVRWMRQHYQRIRQRNGRAKHFTPYSQRPVDLYFRYKHPEQNMFQDETMGANLAPQTVRMCYLKRHFGDLRLVEVWPKLALFYLQKPLKLTKREVLSYRNIEHGTHVRQKIIERLVARAGIFIYERDLKKFLANVASFDSFLCALVALQCDLDRVVKFRSDLPLDSGWVQIPEL